MYQWMEADLAANAGQCVLAYSHRAKYSTQEGASLPTYLNPHWDLLQSYGTDVYLGGHYHLYERYARMDSAGNVDPNGIASFVVGGGGHSLRDYTAATPPGLQNRAKAFGALEMTLNSNGYTFNFVRTGGPEQITDSGTGTC